MPRKTDNDNFAAALTEVSDRLGRLVHDEIELAKTEMIQKASSLARGAAAVAAGAVFGIFAVIFLLLTLAWVLDGIFVSGAGSLWLGFLIVLVILVILTVGAFLFAWRKLKVGAPTPKLAISEGKKIKDTVTSFGTGYTPSVATNGIDASGRAQISSARAGAPGTPPTPSAPAPAPTPPARSDRESSAASAVTSSAPAATAPPPPSPPKPAPVPPTVPSSPASIDPARSSAADPGDPTATSSHPTFVSLPDVGRPIPPASTSEPETEAASAAEVEPDAAPEPAYDITPATEPENPTEN